MSINRDSAEEAGVIMGNSVGGLLSVCKQIRVLDEMGPSRVSPVLAPTMTGDAASVQVSLTLGTSVVRTDMSNSFGFGGHNSVLIFRRFQNRH